MKLFSIIIIYLAGNVDIYLLLMRKGATCRALTKEQHLINPSVCALTSIVSITIGHLLGKIFHTGFLSKFSIFIAGFILFFLGLYILWKGQTRPEVIERVDESFTLEKTFQRALFTNIDNLFVAMYMSIRNVNFFASLFIGVILNFIISFIGLQVGYRQGFYGKWVPRCCGIFLIFVGLFISFNFVF